MEDPKKTWMKRGLVLLVVPLSLLLLRCFSPDLPVCSFQCYGSACPQDYECRDDGYCHLIGTTAACNFPTDLRTPAAPDLNRPDGGTPGSDMEGADMEADMSGGM